MIKRIRIQNLKSLKDTGWIEMKPLTVLVGTNSSGKSTFLRWFPLMSQTVASNIRVPILWFDESMVDFGDFSTSISKFADKEEEIVFSFDLLLNLYLTKIPYPIRRRIDRFFLGDNLQLSLKYKDSTKGTTLSKMIIYHQGNTAEFLMDNTKDSFIVKFNDADIAIPNLKSRSSWRHAILPEFEWRSKNKEITFVGRPLMEMENLIVEDLKSLCSRKFKHSEKLISLINLWSIDKSEFLQRLHKYNGIKTLSQKLKGWTIDTPEFIALYGKIYVMKIFVLLEVINADLVSSFEGVDYIAPLRAAGQRYYRNRGLQIDKIDPYGNNLGEFIDSLTVSQKLSYDKFLEKVLKVKIAVKKASGHQSIEIIKDGVAFNLTDVGFGYSQILPIVTKLWLATEKGNIRKRGYGRTDILTTVIEQPELHLHSALQGKLTDAFLRCISGDQNENNEEELIDYFGNMVQIIIETHSPTILNRIGRRIRECHIKHDDIQILIFDKKSASEPTQIRNVKFDSEGMLEDWPYGFFDAENDEF